MCMKNQQDRYAGSPRGAGTQKKSLANRRGPAYESYFP
jgi:hypothetical protein